MRKDDGMNSPLEYAYVGGRDRIVAPTPPDAPRSRAVEGEDGRAGRCGNGDDDSAVLPTTIGSTGPSERTKNVALGKQLPVSSTLHVTLGPPSTPAPHNGFRRNTAIAMTAGRRVSHRSSSATVVKASERELPSSALSSSDAWEGLQRSSQSRSSCTSEEEDPHPPTFKSNGLTATKDTSNGYGDGVFSQPRNAQRHAGEAVERALATTTSPGTLPSNHRHLSFDIDTADSVTEADGEGGGSYRRSYDIGGNFFPSKDVDATLPMVGDDDKFAPVSDRRTGYRYSDTRRSGIGSTTSVWGESNSASTPQPLPPPRALHQILPSSVSAMAIKECSSSGGPTWSKAENDCSERVTSRPTSSSPSGVSVSPLAYPLRSTSESVSPPPPSVWFTGFTAQQQQRFEALQACSPPGHELARWKMLELLRHWMGMSSTRNAIETVVRSILAEAGIVKTREAWGGSETLPSASRASSMPQANGVDVRSTRTATTTSLPSAESSPAEGSSKNVTTDKQMMQESTSEPALSALNTGEVAKGTVTPISEEALAQRTECEVQNPAPQQSASVVEVSSGTAEKSPSSPLADAGASSAKNRRFSGPHRRRRSRGEKTTTASPKEPLREAEGTSVVPSLGTTNGVGDDLVESSGKKITPEKNICSDTISPMGVSPPQATLDLTPGRLTDSTSANGSPVEVGLHDSSRNSSTVLHRSRSGRNLVTTGAQSSVQQAASYEDIPRFYFPLGRPTMSDMIISGPLSKNHENPHLKIVDGVTMTAPMYDGGEDARLSPDAEALVGSSDESVLPEVHRSQKVAPMSHLHTLADRQVAHHIQREFGRLPPYPRHVQRVRLLSGRLRSGGSHHSSLPFAKQELLYKQQFIQCIQRLCSQCFGVPRYFAFLIMRLIQWEANKGVVDSPGEDSRPSGRLGSSRSGSFSALLNHSNNQDGTAAGLSSIFLITAQHMKDFYEAHLKGKDTMRRIFDLLALSSRLPSSAAAAASQAVLNATTEASGPPVSNVDLPSNAHEPSGQYLLPRDFVAYVDALLNYHPGLAFLRQTPDFQTKYLDTVIYRIFYELDRMDRGAIRFSEMAASRFVDALRQVDSAEDINTVLLFFSYEHFYVLYCRFWELDEDRDMMLAPEDLMRYAPEDVMNPSIVQRVFAGVGRRRRCRTPNRIGYEDFVWFCLSEEDKSTPQAIRYWFRVLDLDGDGVLSVYELREFYDATRNKIAQYVQEGLVSFEDVICQVFDMMRCSEYRGLLLSDLLREREAAAVALNLLTNVVKFLQFEQRDPFVSHQERLMGGPEQSAWDRFARLEYDRMALEADNEG